MTVVILGDQFDEIVPEIQKALDGALKNTLNLQQGALAKANPKDTGRMASSWFIGQNQPRLDSRSENWAEPGAERVEIEKFNQKITFDGDWYISNNVPYAIYTALNYKPSAKAQKDWYTSTANQTLNVFNRQFDKLKP